MTHSSSSQEQLSNEEAATILSETLLDLWMGTFTGREVASRKSVTSFLRIISGWMGRKCGLDDERDVLLDDDSLENDRGELAWHLIGCMR